MNKWEILVLIVITVQILDNLITLLYSHLSRRMYKKIKLASRDIPNKKDGENITYSILKRVYAFYGGWVRYKLIILGRIPSHMYRKWKLKFIYRMKLSPKVVIYGGFEIRSPWNISIGEGSVIGDEAKLDGRNGIQIGKNVNLSTGVWIWTEQHDVNDPFFLCNNKGGKVVIEDYVWLSNRVTILPNCIVKEGTVIAAGAVVTKDCLEYRIYGGVPAKEIGTRQRPMEYEFSGKHLPFF